MKRPIVSLWLLPRYRLVNASVTTRVAFPQMTSITATQQGCIKVDKTFA